MRRRERGRKRLIRSICKHTATVLVHAVEGGYRAHCLRCGTVGPVLKTREAAQLALSFRANDAKEGARR